MTPPRKHIKRYLVFACEGYYPAGGWGDFIGAFDDLGKARSAEERADRSGKYAYTVDLETLEEVERPR